MRPLPTRRPSERYLLGADLFLDVGRQRLERNGSEIALPKLSFDFLLALVRAAPNVVKYDELMALVWPGVVVTPETSSQRAKLSRAALGDDPESPKVIRGVRGRGYVLACAALPHVSGEGATRQLSATTPAPTRPGLHLAATGSEPSPNLPFTLTPLLGRDDDLAALRELLGCHRLVTVLGAGGIGKTRLALAVAHAVAASFSHGVAWVDLAALSGDARLATAIANAARLQLRDGDGPAQIAQVMAARQSLLVMDNCEHLVDGTAQFVEAVLAGAPGVRLLATSQLPLKVASEQIYRIGPLAIPPRGSPLETARSSGATQLLEQRTRAIDHTFTLDSDNYADASVLCRHLDCH